MQARMVDLHEICRCHRRTKLLIHKWPFAYLVHEIVQKHGAHDLCFQVCTVKALQEAAEYYLAYLFDDSNLCSIHAKCVTIMSQDIHLACCIHRE